jgi:hypothetical protein
MIRMLILAGLACSSSLCAAACHDGSEDDPNPLSVRNGERIAWEQRADSRSHLGQLTYKLYVDGAEAPLANVRCDEVQAAPALACSGELPLMAAGRHSLEITSRLNGQESPRSSRLSIVVSASNQR